MPVEDLTEGPLAMESQQVVPLARALAYAADAEAKSEQAFLNVASQVMMNTPTRSLTADL